MQTLTGAIYAFTLVAVALGIGRPGAEAQSVPALPHARGPMLHAHNCYPEDGQWKDRLDRALATGRWPMAIEQDLAWAADRNGGTSVVSHTSTLTGGEPTFEDYFFRRVAPLMEGALREGRRDQWPLLVLHLDFKTNEPEHHRAVWTLLGRYRHWLTTAERPTQPSASSALAVGPMLVLTENGTGQVESFYGRVPVGERLRLFGTVVSTEDVPIPQPGTVAAEPRAYRRWVNLPWRAAEGETQQAATSWNATKATRLAELVAASHKAGWWLRFYVINGHETPRNGWNPSYNVGTEAAALARWRAAIAAGVDLMATDQYEELARALRGK